MGHATHFLQRLDRVNELQVELALSLYRDDALLKAVLGSVELPAAAERVAISLGDPREGPFVVLTRTGRFVTCLGEGMRVSDLPVITRAQFDVAAGRVQRMRDELDRIKQLCEAGAGGEVKRLLRAMDTAGPRFYREDAQRLSLVAPLLAPWAAERVAVMTQTVFEQLPRMAALRCDKLTAREREALLAYGCLVWALGHALPLLAVSETRQLMKKVGDDTRAIAEYHFSAAAFELFTVAHGHRALWVVARSGKAGLSLARQPQRAGERTGRIAFRELALAAIAFGSPSLRSQAVHKLTPTAHAQDVNARFAFGAFVADSVRRRALDDAEQASSAHAAIGRELVRAVLPPSDAPEASSDADALLIPDHLAHAAAATVPACWIAGPTEFGHLNSLGLALPWLARAPLEELYLPRAWADRLLPELSVETIALWLKPCAEAHRFGRPRTVVRDAPKPARNAACSCGSGEKWKRCCGGKTAALATHQRAED